MNKDRVDYIDVAKGIGICLVIWGHLFTYGSQISSIIFSFHMPLFFSLIGVFAVIYLSNILKKCKLLSYIGKNSLVIFSLHSFGIYLFTYILSRKYGTTIINGNNMSNKDAIIGGFFVLGCMLLTTIIWNGLKRSFSMQKRNGELKEH